MKAMLFGSFDGLHKGHHNFIHQAEAYTHDLVIVLAPDSSIKKLKDKNPRFSEKERIHTLRENYPRHYIVLGDDIEGSWQVIKDHQPDIILLGYDQDALENALIPIQEEYGFDIKRLLPFYPETYKSSLLQ